MTTPARGHVLPLTTAALSLHRKNLPGYKSPNVEFGMSLVIGIDIGTSGVRAMAVDERGRIMGPQAQRRQAGAAGS